MGEGKKQQLAERLMFSLGKMARGLDSIFRKEMEKYNVTWAQFGVLRIVDSAGKMTVTDIANILMIATPTASRMVDGICKKGLLRKESDPGDQRLTWITTTEEGSELVNSLVRLERDVMSDILEEEDEEELERTVGHLVSILDRWFAVTEGESG